MCVPPSGVFFLIVCVCVCVFEKSYVGSSQGISLPISGAFEKCFFFVL